MSQICMAPDISSKSSPCLPQLRYPSVAGGGRFGYFDEGEGDTRNFGGVNKIFTTKDNVGTSAANVLPDLIKRLKEISALSDNWDGRGTAAPNALAYFHAWDVIGVLREMNFVPAKLMPSADEGIGFYFSNKNKYGFVECYNDGEIVVAMSDRKGYRKIRQIGDTIVEIKDELETLKVFIDAS